MGAIVNVLRKLLWSSGSPKRYCCFLLKMCEGSEIWFQFLLWKRTLGFLLIQVSLSFIIRLGFEFVNSWNIWGSLSFLLHFSYQSFWMINWSSQYYCNKTWLRKRMHRTFYSVCECWWEYGLVHMLKVFFFFEWIHK